MEMTFTTQRLDGETYGILFEGTVIGKHAKDIAETLTAKLNQAQAAALLHANEALSAQAAQLAAVEQAAGDYGWHEGHAFTPVEWLRAEIMCGREAIGKMQQQLTSAQATIAEWERVRGDDPRTIDVIVANERHQQATIQRLTEERDIAIRSQVYGLSRSAIIEMDALKQRITTLEGALKDAIEALDYYKLHRVAGMEVLLYESRNEHCPQLTTEAIKKHLQQALAPAPGGGQTKEMT